MALSLRLLAPLSFVALLLVISNSYAPEGSAKLITIYSWAMLVSILSRIGFDQLIFEFSLHFTQQNNRIANRVVSNALGASLSIAIVLLSSLYLLSKFYGVSQPFDKYNTALLYWIVLGMTLSNLAASCAQSKGATLTSVLLFPFLLNVSITLALISDFSVQASTGIAITISSFFSFIYLVKNFQLSVRYLKFGYIFKSAKYYALNLNKLVFDWGLSYYIAVTLGAPTALLFLFANRIASLSALPLTALNTYILPLFSINHRTAGIKNKSLAKKVVYLTFSSQILILTFLFIFYDSIVGISQQDSAELYGVLLPLIVAQVVNVITGPAGSILLMSGSARSVVIVSIVSAILSLTASVQAAHLFGVQGVAFVIAAGLIFQNLTYAVLLYRRDGYNPAIEAIQNIFHDLK